MSVVSDFQLHGKVWPRDLVIVSKYVIIINNIVKPTDT